MTRKLYRAKLEFLFTMDGAMPFPVPEVKRRVQEHVNEAYSKMEREDLRVTLQTDFGVAEVPA